MYSAYLTNWLESTLIKVNFDLFIAKHKILYNYDMDGAIQICIKTLKTIFFKRFLLQYSKIDEEYNLVCICSFTYLFHNKM